MSLWLVEMREGLMELCILNLLRQGEKHSYEIFQLLHKIEKLAVTDSRVYPLLVELLKNGKVKICAGSSNSSLTRQTFSLTALGRRRVQEMNAYWHNLEEDIDLFLSGSAGESQ